MTIQDILQAREERVQLQAELQKIYRRPLLTHRVNTPGENKDTPVSRGIFNAVEAALQEHFGGRIIAEKMLLSAEGPVMIRVMDETPEALKAEATTLENTHPLGRFVDLDVYGLDGVSLSRSALGVGPRSCYVCSEPAHGCARSRRHPVSELLAAMERAYQGSIKP